MDTAIRAFSAIKLLFCSLAFGALVALVSVPETAELAAANNGEFLNNKAAVVGSNIGGGGPGGGP